MAERIITTSTAQERVLAWIVATRNRENGTDFTIDQFLQSYFNSFMSPYEIRYREAESDAVKTGFDHQPDQQIRDEIKTRLGVTF